MAYRTGTTAITGGTTQSVVIPAGVQVGDAMLIAVGTNNLTTISTPAGWTLEDSRTGASSRYNLYSRVCQAGDPGSTVNFTIGLAGKTAAMMAAYSDRDTTDPTVAFTGASEGTSQATHTTPGVTTAIDDCDIVQIVMVKSLDATTWTEASPLVERQQSTQAGSAPNGAIADYNGLQPAGTYGSKVFTSDIAGGQGAMWSIALAPKVSTQTVRPSSDITVISWTAVPTASPLANDLNDSNDATYVETEANPTARVGEWKFPTIGGKPRVVRAKVAAAGGAASMSTTVALIQNTTVIASVTDTTLYTSPTWVALTLDDTQRAAITDLTNLRVRVTVTAA